MERQVLLHHRTVNVGGMFFSGLLVLVHRDRFLPATMRRVRPPYEHVCTRLGQGRARVGFEPYSNGTWIVDPGTTALT
ncbi:hypothetical protein ACFYM2_25470 [Streptomyces sp. NPDC006711]|uniref:hypothetical protein n=1 Tax=Streptomyces sp. NPDC006711 TaxID=3364762 RepID=UPI0036AC520B